MTEGTGQENGAVGGAGEFNESGQAAGEAGDRTGRIDDDEANVVLPDGEGKLVKVARQVEGTKTDAGLWSFLNGGPVEHQAGGIAAGGHKTRKDDLFGGVIGRDEQDIDGLSLCAIGQGCATGEAGSESKGAEGEAGAGGGVEQCNVAEGNAIGPEPGERPALEVSEGLDGGGGVDG